MFECVATATFGLEALVKRELTNLNIEITRSENGRLYFTTNLENLIRINLSLRTADRVYIVLGRKNVTSYDMLFDFVKGLNLKKFVGPTGKYLVDAKSVKSTLFSPRDIQSITKKAWIENLSIAYNKREFLEEDERYKILVNIQKDEAEIWLDSSGEALFKRGYRTKQGKAPLKETLAAALVMLTFYHADRTLYDPFCGSGTIAIEAAMIAKNIAPGLNRRFDFEAWPWCDKATFKKVKGDLMRAIDYDKELSIVASDLDPHMIEMAKENAEEAGVDDAIHFHLARFEHMQFDAPYGIVVTNPPYAERLGDEEGVRALYEAIGKVIKEKEDYSFNILSSFMGTEKALGKRAQRTRVLFNGNIKSRYYQYLGPAPKE